MIDAKDMGINIVEAGHFFTENPVCNTIKNHLLEISQDFNISIYNSNNISFK
jgi:putative NIF3 family GTP cyclohydrolase 1 type 2